MFRGSITALVTPFRDGRIDEPALRRMVQRQIGEGTHALVPVGTTGESATLSQSEHKRVVEVVVEEAGGACPIIAGAGSNNPREAIDYSRHAAETGADATLHVAGYYNRPNQEGLFRHFQMLHDAVDLPIIVYNIPPRAVVDIRPETLARIAELPGVAGVKDATGDLNRPLLEGLLITKPFAFLSGDDGTAVAYNASGGCGCISVTANIAPAHCAHLQEACANGDFATALSLQRRLMPLHQALFAEPSPAGAKYAASLLGLCAEECRIPIVPLADSTRMRIRQAMESLELI